MSRKKKNEGAIEKVRAEVVTPEPSEVVAPVKSDAEGLKRQIKNALAVADSNNMELGQESNLERMWDEVCQFSDTNEMVRLNLQQIQVMFQEQFEKYYKRKAEHDQILAQILEKGEDYVTEYVEMEKSFRTEQENDLKTVMNLSQRVEAMAKEYRQCSLQKKWMVHISQVVSFRLAVESTIHRHISDPKVLSAISNDLRRAAVDLFANVSEEQG